ncbi:MAG: lipoate--protein ligase family protein [Gemmatimonadaceae bacterium]|nr:lipoate--protein ligase family protein [Gemmatimonadaceae bacterium]
MHWRFLATPPRSGAENMALDEALLRRAASSGEAVLRIYAWSAPTLSLGRNQPAHGEYDLGALASGGIDVVRRLTGGRAVLHHREITYSVTAPLTLGATLRDAYLRINEILVGALRSLGANAEISGRAGAGERAPLPSLAPCFEEPTEGELVLAGRKLVGSAQYREEVALLQHGSILVDDDQTDVASLLTTPVAPPPRPATLRAALGRVPGSAEVNGAFLGALREREDPRVEELAIDESLERAAATARDRYVDPAWTWRR